MKGLYQRRCEIVPRLAFVWILFHIVTFAMLLLSLNGLAQEMPLLRISGNAEFKLKWSAGDADALAGTGYIPGRPDLSQLLSLRVQGQVTPGLSISADLDNRKGGNLQMLELTLDGEMVRGRLGGLSVKTSNPYTAYSGRLRGMEMTASLPKIELSFAAGRVQGIGAKKTFRGSSAEEAIIYTAQAPYGPSPTDRGFEACLAGMQYYILTEAFDPDFMQVWFRFENEAEEGGRTLRETLQLWDLDYLYQEAPEAEGGISAGTKIPLAAGQFATVSSSRELLALRMEALDILRGQVQAIIRAYNAEHGFIDAERKRYPFNFASEAEIAFLTDLLTKHTHISVGVENEHHLSILETRADAYLQNSLYDLGQTNVEPGSLQIEVRRGISFQPIETELPLLFQVEYEQGIIEFDFPPDFFTVYNGIRVRYTYEIAEGIFNLGLSIVEGSERVYLNDAPLTSGSDYLLDYELGILTIFRIVSPEDVVRVEYEYFRGPFGRIADYKSNFYAASAGWTPHENLELQLELAAYMDRAKSAQMPDSTPTMPNSHLIAGLSGQYQRENLTISGDAAFSHNTFPFDDNLKPRAPNRITAIMEAMDGEGLAYLLITHNDGISAGFDEFRNYGVGAGLSSPTVRALTTVDDTWFFATDHGLTVFSAIPGPSGQNPFDYIGNWKRIYMSDGLPDNDIISITATPWKIWLATAAGYLACADLGVLDSWDIISFPGGPVFALAYDRAAGKILAAADGGLYASEGNRFTLELPHGSLTALWSSSTPVKGMHSFAAGNDGLFGRKLDGNWQAIPAPADLDTVHCLTTWQEKLWMGTEDGLYVWDGEIWEVIAPTMGYAITALGAGPAYKHAHGESLWAGTAGKAAQGSGHNTIMGFEILDRTMVVHRDGLQLAVSPDDPGRYLDLRREGHTASGCGARIQAKYDLKNASVYGSYESVAPGFMKIAQSSRQAAKILRLGTRWSINPQLALTAEHTRTLTDSISAQEPGKGTERNTTRIVGSFDLGPQIDVALNLGRMENKQIPGSEEREQGVSISGRESFFENRLTVGASYERSRNDNLLRPENSFVQTILRGEARLTLNNISFTGSYRRPAKTIDPGGENERSSGITETRFNANWNKQLGETALRARFNHTSRGNLATLKMFANKTAELRLTLPNIQIGSGRLIPGAVLQWNSTIPFSGQQRQTITAQGNITGDLANIRTTSGLALKRINYTGIDKLVFDTEIFTSLSFNTEKALRPQFDLRWKRSKSERPDLGTATTDSLSGTARLIWVPAQGVYNTASAIYSLSSSALPAGKRTQALTLQNTINYAWSEKLSLTGTANIKLSAAATRAEAEHEQPEIKCSLTGRINYRFNEIWSLGTTFGYHLHNGRKPAQPITKAFSLEAGLKATF